MKKILFLIILILSAITYEISAQEFLTQLDNEFCNCVSKETNYSNKTFEDCSAQVIPKYQKDLVKLYPIDNNQNDKDDFMNTFMIRLLKNCDSFYYHMEDLKKSGIKLFKTEYQNISFSALQEKFKKSQNIQDYWEMANWKFANNEYEDAGRMYNEILKNEPNQIESVYMLALLYDELGKYKEAKILYDKVYETNPKIEYKLYSEMDLRKMK